MCRRWRRSRCRCTGSRACCGSGAGATTRSPESGSASRRRRSTRAGSRSCACWPRRCATVSTGSGRSAARRCALALGLALLAFLAANPYAALDPNEFFSGVSQQASQTAGPFKLGSNPGSGIKYYLWTFTWGLGWVPTLATLGGAALLLVRRRLALALVLLPAPLAFIVFMGNQQRFFGRWLMPIFPIVALLGAYGAVELARALSRSRGPAPARRLMPAALAGALVAAAMLGQSVAADVHNDQVLSRPDTRNLARAWMVKNIPAGSKVVIEPLVPDNWALDVGKVIPVTPTGERWWRYPTWLTNLDQNLNPLPAGQHQYVFVDQYERYLYPQLLDQYAAQGYCWVVIGSLQAGRAFAQPDAVPQAVLYYAELSRRAKLVYQVSPFAPGDHPDRFSFDWSIDYYPDQYRLPGPEIGIYHLSGGNCSRPARKPGRANTAPARPTKVPSAPVNRISSYARPEMSAATEIDQRHLARAIELAEQGRGQVSPNPLVGAVIGRQETVIGEGFHRALGEPHAEVEAIRSAADQTLAARRCTCRSSRAATADGPVLARKRSSTQGSAGWWSRPTIRVSTRPGAGWESSATRASRWCSSTASSRRARSSRTSRSASTLAPAGRGSCSSRR